MAGNPFAVAEAAKKLKERGSKVAAAVKAAEGDAVVRRDNAVTPVRTPAPASSFAPRPTATRTYGAPMGVTPVTPSQTERARRGQTNPGQD
jgi:hypothetical protein